MEPNKHHQQLDDHKKEPLEKNAIDENVKFINQKAQETMKTVGEKYEQIK